MRMIKKAQFGWIGNFTGSKYIMGPLGREENSNALTQGVKSTLKKKVKKVKDPKKSAPTPKMLIKGKKKKMNMGGTVPSANTYSGKKK